MLQRATAIIVTLSCLGCWQEVRYEPDTLESGSTVVAAKQPSEPTELPPPEPTTQENPPLPSPEELFKIQDSGIDPPTQEVISVPDAEDPPLSEKEPNDRPPNSLESTTQPVDPFGEEIEANSTQPKIDEPAESVTAEQPSDDSAEPERTAVVSESFDAKRSLFETWRMSSNWSMAAALQAKGAKKDRYGKLLDQAMASAELLEVSLPKLPDHQKEADRLKLNLNYLLSEAGPQLARELTEQHGAEHSALSELATKTHILLLSYTPNSSRLEPVVVAIRKAAIVSGLPEEVWSELVDRLESRADFLSVKEAVFQLHKDATKSLNSR